MFDNILGQQRVVSQLEADITSGNLAPSMLFTGPQFSGKSSTALELTRLVACERERQWSCTCPSCVQQRALVSPYLLQVGSRPFLKEIRAAARALERKPSMATGFLLARAVRKLTRRFDPVLWEGDEQKISKAYGSLGKIYDLLDNLSDSLGLDRLDPPEAVDRSALASLADQLVGESASLRSILPAEGVPASQLRRIIHWTHSSRSDKPRFVIIEEAHQLNDTARNTLLKILEEPPQNTYFILLSHQASSILPTLRSRLRNYQFDTRSPEKALEVIQRVFRDSHSPAMGLESYIRSQQGEGINSRGEALELLNLLLRPPGQRSQDEDRAEFIRMREELKLDKEGIVDFMNELVDALLDYVGNNGDVMGHRERETVTRLRDQLARSMVFLQAYNVSLPSVLDKLYLEIRGGQIS